MRGNPSPSTGRHHLRSEITQAADLFGVPDRADGVIEAQQQVLDGVSNAGDGQTVFWYDMGDSTPTAGVGSGGPQLIIEAVGATNIFADIEGGWVDVSWEQVLAADPDVIVLADASWSTAQEKIDYMQNDPVLRDLRAVEENRFVVIPFSESTPGVRLADGAATVAEGLADLN